MPSLCILIPVFNDWSAVDLLLTGLDRALVTAGRSARILLIDDGSSEPYRDTYQVASYRAIRRLDILSLRRNLGHQRAIAVGLVYLHQRNEQETVVIMDGDGEDRPEDVPKMLDRFEHEGGERVIFAERTKRLESVAFRFFYRIYRGVHWVLTGHKVRVGNFSVVPWAVLDRLVVVSELWNHFAASIFRSRIPYSTLPLARGGRLSGQPQMNFISLVIHGLSAVSVFSDIVGARFSVAAILLIVLATLGIIGTAAIRFWTDLAVPGWATYAFGILGIVFLQGVLLSFVLVFVILGGRSQAGFIPLRDCPYFIGTVRNLRNEA